MGCASDWFARTVYWNVEQTRYKSVSECGVLWSLPAQSAWLVSSG